MSRATGPPTGDAEPALDANPPDVLSVEVLPFPTNGGSHDGGGPLINADGQPT